MSKRQGGKVKPTKAPISKAAAEKKKQALEEKTFGMKNKKGKTAQKTMQSYQSAGKTKEEKKKDQEREARKQAKLEKEKLEQERAMLFKTVEPAKPKQKIQTVEPGVDPKSVLCINFKAGYCQAGDECKFSHDLAVERKGEKRDLYSDQRDLHLEDDTMDKWDEKKLNEVIAKKTSGRTATNNLVCNHFLKAIEEQKFGWFWECPSGDKCPYRHALPANYEFKKKKEDKVVERPIEDILEEQRQCLPATGGTPVTAKTFFEWKEKIMKQRELEEKKNKQARAQAIQQGKMRKTGKEILQESAGTFKEELEGDDLDILELLKKKKEEEDQLDKENAEIVQKISAEVAESEKAFDREVAELEKQGLSAHEAIAKLTLRNNNSNNNNNNNNNNNSNNNLKEDDSMVSPREDGSLISPREDEDEDEEGEGEDEDDGEEKVLVGVDTGLFTGDGEEELPEFSDDE